MKNLEKISMLILILMVLLLTVCLILMPFEDANSRDFTTVAVIDTGIDLNILKQGHTKGMCKMGHRDFTGYGLKDESDHGNNISGIIHKYAKGSNYCQVVLKYYDSYKATKKEHIAITVAKAIEYAIDINVDIINLSLSGFEPHEREKAAIIKALNKGIKIVVAAGNDESDLSKYPTYPAMYDPRIDVIGYVVRELTYNEKAKDYTSKITKGISNYGKGVDFAYETTYDAYPLPYGKLPEGSSAAAAIHTGKLVKVLSK